MSTSRPAISRGNTPGPPPPVISALMTFTEGSRAALDYLGSLIPMAYWGAVRLDTGGHTLAQRDPAAHPGETDWSAVVEVNAAEASAVAVAGDGSTARRFVTIADAAPVDLQAYVGVPVREADGELFGVLAGLDSRRPSEDLARHTPLLELVSSLLGMVLAADRARDEAARIATEARLAAQVDPVTGLHNRAAWELLVSEQETRYSKYADPTILVSVQIDDLRKRREGGGHWRGDEHLGTVSAILSDATRTCDVLARVAEDAFALMLRECTVELAELRISVLDQALREAGSSVSLGWAPARIDGGINQARTEADAALVQAQPDAVGGGGDPTAPVKGRDRDADGMA